MITNTFFLLLIPPTTSLMYVLHMRMISNFIMINNLHLGIKFQCPDCDYEATAEGHMATHQKSVHLGIEFVIMKQQ